MLFLLEVVFLFFPIMLRKKVEVAHPAGLNFGRKHNGLKTPNSPMKRSYHPQVVTPTIQSPRRTVYRRICERTMNFIFAIESPFFFTTIAYFASFFLIKRYSKLNQK